MSLGPGGAAGRSEPWRLLPILREKAGKCSRAYSLPIKVSLDQVGNLSKKVGAPSILGERVNPTNEARFPQGALIMSGIALVPLIRAKRKDVRKKCPHQTSISIRGGLPVDFNSPKQKQSFWVTSPAQVKGASNAKSRPWHNSVGKGQVSSRIRLIRFLVPAAGRSVPQLEQLYLRAVAETWQGKASVPSGN